LLETDADLDPIIERQPVVAGLPHLFADHAPERAHHHADRAMRQVDDLGYLLLRHPFAASRMI